MKPAAENNLIGDQFFLTRQSANLMEDFAREINKGSSLFLLYGISAVGKSRLLQELTDRGIDNHKFCWINFRSKCVETKTMDDSPGSDTDSFVNEIKELMEAADKRDVIFVDHFELASNKAKHQLFQSWTTDGVDKNINLTIATTTACFNEVKQLAQQYKVKIKSFQLMPCSMAEVEAFLGCYLFPASPLNNLSIPTEIKKQLRSCNGVLGKVIEVANRQGKQISIKPESESKSKTYAVVTAGSLLLVLVVTGIFYQYRQSDIMLDSTLLAPSDKTITIVSDNEDVVSISQSEPGTTISSDEAIQSTDSSQIVDQENKSPIVPDLETQIVDSKPSNVELQIEPEQPTVEVDITAKLEPEGPLIENKNQPVNPYQRDLDNSLKWIEEQDKDTGTIQIMMIGIESFNNGTFHRYLERLKSNNIDVSEIRIYQTNINDSVVFGVIFGDYESRREASKGINQLPDALKAREPIPRSIGGILDEINNK